MKIEKYIGELDDLMNHHINEFRYLDKKLTSDVRAGNKEEARIGYNKIKKLYAEILPLLTLILKYSDSGVKIRSYLNIYSDLVTDNPDANRMFRYRDF